METVLIAGCGDIGRRVAARYREQSIPVTGIVRSPESSERLTAAGITAIRWDPGLEPKPAGLNITNATVFYFAPPPPGGDNDPVLEGFLHTMDPNFASRVVYISTSGVYGDCGGDWVTEERPPNPQTGRAIRRLAAENALMDWSKTTGVPVVLLRVPGIYAQDRLPEARIHKALPILREEDSPYTNRIHADDLATICIAAARKGKPGAIYNAADGHPTTMCDYFNRVADYLGLPRPPQVSREAAEQQLTPAMLSFLNESRRIDNTKIRKELEVSCSTRIWIQRWLPAGRKWFISRPGGIRGFATSAGCAMNQLDSRLPGNDVKVLEQGFENRRDRPLAGKALIFCARSSSSRTQRALVPRARA